MKKVSDFLYAMADKDYADFQSSIMPTIDKNSIVGVRTPPLRDLAKEMLSDDSWGDFVASVPHRLFEENQLHAFIVSEIRDFKTAVVAIDRFLPYIDNWATCDQLVPKSFLKHVDELLPYIQKWIKSKHVYTVRFAMLCLKRYFLEERFDTKYADMVAGVKTKEYYINMMQAWYFATALVKQYEQILPYLKKGKLEPWTHNRAIQKAIESYRISKKQKLQLRKLRKDM